MPVELSDDIILHIIHEHLSDVSSLRTLRLVSKSIGSVASALLFSRFLILPPRRPSSNHCNEITHALIHGTTKVFQNVRAVIITHYFFPELEVSQPWVEMLDWLVPAMTNLRSVEWSYTHSQEFPHQPIFDFIHALGSLGTVKEVSIKIDNEDVHVDFSLEPLSGLHSFWMEWTGDIRLSDCQYSQISKLLARSPDLESFKFSIRGCPNLEPNFGEQMTLAEFLDDIPPSFALSKLRRLETRGIVVTPDDFRTHIRHFRNLQSLKVKADPTPSPSTQFGEICAVFQREGVRITALSTDSIDHPNLLEYLASYSGVEHLVLKPSPWYIPHNFPHNFPQLVDKFFESVLPNHCHSLKSLKLGGNKITPWSTLLSSEKLKVVEGCQSLRELTCWLSVSPQDVNDGNGQLLISWLETATRLSDLQKFTIKPVEFQGRDHESGVLLDTGGGHNPDPGIERFVKRVVDNFKRSNDLQFGVVHPLWRRTGRTSP